MEYKQPMEVYAVVFGFLIRTFGKIQSSKVNKIVDELGYDKVTVKLLKDYASQIENDPHLSSILEDAIEGKVTPDEIKEYNTENHPISSEADIHKVVTPYQIAHQRVLKDNREFNKIQREGAYTRMLFEDLKEDIRRELRSLAFGSKKSTKDFEYIYEPKNSTIVVLISDWHIGATVVDHTHHGGYNFEILKARMDYLLARAEKVAHDNQAEKIVCVFVGDLIEGADMRGGQKWGLEFSLSQQIAKGTRLMYEVLEHLSEIAPVDFLAIRGNHDRLTGQANKQDNIYNDSAVFLMLDSLKLFQETGGQLANVNIIDNSIDMYDGNVDIYGKLLHANHGDGLKGTGSHFAKFIEDRAINYLVTGHVHTFKATQDHRDHLHLVVGSPMGYNDYAKELKLTKTAPSQTLIVMQENEDPVLHPVFMEHINLKGEN